jgi:uncharacterized membrane protein
MDGVSRWTVQGGNKASGCGARWDVRLQIGAAPIGGIVEVVEFEEPGDLAWNSVTGVTMRGRWRLRERVPGQTEVVLRLAYQAPGGLMGLIADRVAEPLVRRSLKRSLRNLQMLVESRPAPTKVEGARRAAQAQEQPAQEQKQPAKKAARKATKSVAPAKKATKANGSGAPRKRAAKAG